MSAPPEPVKNASGSSAREIRRDLRTSKHDLAGAISPAVVPGPSGGVYSLVPLPQIRIPSSASLRRCSMEA